MDHVILTPAIVADLVSDCLGTVKVLGIVGRCRKGKTLSLKQWTEETRAQDEPASSVCRQPHPLGE